MQAIRSVGIFLGSSTGINPLFGRKIADLCETFARRSIAVVYGGGNVGLMG
ncbi:MAG: TIGR00730 family Rossman fold protein, partial [Spirochaetae bacterium HGW-Spirochaetae-10]